MSAPIYLILSEFGDAHTKNEPLPPIYLHEGGNGYLDIFKIEGKTISRYNGETWDEVPSLPPSEPF